MKNAGRKSRNPGNRCLSTDEFYRYLAAPKGADGIAEMEMHFSRCSHCREELAAVLKLLEPESGDEAGGGELPLSEAEIAQTTAPVK